MFDLQNEKGNVKILPELIDGENQLEIDEEFVEIGVRREDYVDLAMRME